MTEQCQCNNNKCVHQHMNKANNEIDILQKENSNLKQFATELDETIRNRQQETNEMINTRDGILSNVARNNQKILTIKKCENEQAFRRLTGAAIQPYSVIFGELNEQKEESIAETLNSPVALTNPEYLSTVANRLNSLAVVAQLPFQMTTNWPMALRNMKNPRTFPNGGPKEIDAKVIYINEFKELLLDLSKGSNVYCSINDIDNLINVNEKCCSNAHVAAINLKVGELMVGDIVWEQYYCPGGSYMMKNLRKKLLADIYVEWKSCGLCSNSY
eukprot:379752_1